MRYGIVFIFLLLAPFLYGQQAACDKEITALEAAQTNFTDARASITQYEKYLQNNYNRLTADCRRRMYSLLANFYYIGGAIDTADNCFRKAINFSNQCTDDTAKIYACIDYARFLNQVQPDSFSVYSRIVYEKLLNYTQLNKLKFAAFLSSRQQNAGVPLQLNETELNQLSPAVIADMPSNIKMLWRQYYEFMGSSLLFSPQIAASETAFKMALFFDRNNPDDDNESVSLNNLGLLLQNAGRHAKAVEYFLAAIEKNKANNEEYVMLTTLSNASYSFRMIHRYDVARRYTSQAIDIARRLKLSKNLCRVLSQHASVYIDEGKYAEAENFLRESIALSHSIANKADLCYSMRKLADMFIKKTGQLEEGKILIDSSAYYAKEIGDNSFLYYINNTLANYYFKKANYPQALQAASISYKESLAFNDNEITEANLNILYQLYEKQNNPALAYQYYKMYVQLRDSTTGKDMQLALSDIQERYESQQKQLAIDGLEKDKLKKQFQTNILSGALALMLVLFGLFIFFNQKLNRQKKQLELSNKMLAEVTASQNRLFGIIGHDLKGMVAPFSKAGKIMSNYVAKNNMADAEKFSVKLEEYAGRLSETLNNLLHWSLQQMKGLKVQREQVNVSEAILHVVKNYEDVLKYKHIAVQVLIPAADILFTDKEAFHVIVRNLLSNAIKFTENGSIIFKGENTGADYIFSITDNGTGMAEEQVKNLFTLQEKKSLTGTRGEAGSGLGLQVVQKITAALDAQIAVRSKLQAGTTITVTFKI